MKFASAVITSLALAGGADAFAPSLSSRPSATALSATNSENGKERWGPAVVSAVAGLTFAAQASVATVPETSQSIDSAAQTTGSSVVVGAIETMDFSLPSYGDAMGGSVKAKADKPPSFNPFGDFDFTKKDDFTLDSKPAEEEAPAPAPAPKLPSFGMPKIELPKAPEPEAVEEAPAPKLELPKVELPKVDMPKVDIPKVEIPKVDIPKVEVPEMPKMEMPKVELPKLGMPKFEMPKLDMPEMPSVPKVEMPKYDLDVPKVDIPKVDIPKVDMPKVNMPSMPSVGLPSLPNPFGGGGDTKKADDAPLAPREQRDETARLTRQAFLAADQDVKEAEAALNALKDVRKAKKETANAAKDLACADRPGGKLICLRNPFSAGF